jgi:hypothetical protein
MFAAINLPLLAEFYGDLPLVNLTFQGHPRTDDIWQRITPTSMPPVVVPAAVLNDDNSAAISAGPQGRRGIVPARHDRGESVALCVAQSNSH